MRRHGATNSIAADTEQQRSGVHPPGARHAAPPRPIVVARDREAATLTSRTDAGAWLWRRIAWAKLHIGTDGTEGRGEQARLESSAAMLTI